MVFALSGIDHEAVDEFERRALLERERARIERRRIDHALIRPYVEARRTGGGKLHKRHALARLAVGEIEGLGLDARDGARRSAARETAHIECGGDGFCKP